MFEVGQKVWDVVVGEGVVVYINPKYNYPVAVALSDGSERTYTTDGKSVKSNVTPSIYTYPVEIVKKDTKPSINWEHVRGEYKFLAQDSKGVAWLYSEEPTLSKDFWDVSMGLLALADTHASYTPGTCDWKDSLIARQKDA